MNLLRWFLLAAVLVSSGCAIMDVQRRLHEPEDFRSQPVNVTTESRAIKAHMKNGEIYVFQYWEIEGDSLVGRGTRYSAERERIGAGKVSVPLSSIALIESNIRQLSGSLYALALPTAVTAGLAVYCIIDPKACFGSCPTFYDASEGTESLVAEGFSSSVAPALEATDVDALPNLRVFGGKIRLWMKNEALETHVVRHVDLIAAPHTAGTGVFRDFRDGLWETSEPAEPDAAIGPEGDCTEHIRSADGDERVSLADEDDLADKESIDLIFRSPPQGAAGLVVTMRQSLLSTFLFYQTLAYMGKEAGYWLARIDSEPMRGAFENLKSLVGTVKVLRVHDDGSEVLLAEVDEQGPLARDEVLVPFPHSGAGPLRVRITMTKGMWRIDRTGLVSLAGKAVQERIRPSRVIRNGDEDGEALGTLLDGARTLVTFPGDVYMLEYDIPAELTDAAWFLESRGYYLEWMREEWEREENPALLAELFFQPSQALRRLAPEYKRREPQMEHLFWRSKYAHP